MSDVQDESVEKAFMSFGDAADVVMAFSKRQMVLFLADINKLIDEIPEGR